MKLSCMSRASSQMCGVRQMPIRKAARNLALRHGALEGASDAEVYACVAGICTLAALPLLGSIALTIWGA
jgi:hypothetical protein